MRTLITIAGVFGLTVLALCQRPPAPYYEDTNNIPVSPEVHPDRTVTFRLFAPKASEVVLMGSPGILEVIKNPKPLQKDPKGVWSLTVGPLPPGFYTYGYAMDGGLRIPDPANPNLELRRWGPTSSFIVPGSEKAVFEERNVPHGTVHIDFYDSKNLGMPRMFYVYTPPGYESDQQRYPVLYLLHGNGQIEASWTWTGRANVILDNLLADGRIKPMIVVMPYGHLAREMRSATPATSGPSDMLVMEKELLTGVQPEVESKYRVWTDREHRAIAGLSMSAAQSLSIGLHNLDSFAYIAAFSGGGNRAEWEKADPAVLNRQLKVLWLGCGSEDAIYQSVKGMDDLLTEKKVKHVFNSSGAGIAGPTGKSISRSTPLCCSVTSAQTSRDVLSQSGPCQFDPRGFSSIVSTCFNGAMLAVDGPHRSRAFQLGVSFFHILHLFCYHNLLPEKFLGRGSVLRS